MASQPLKRLALWCTALGLLLALALGLLVASTRSQLHEQRQLRHQMVAERVVDEMERELSLLLLREQRRPAYGSVEATSPNAWAPFVVGYFRLTGGEPELLAEADLAPERRERVVEAVVAWRGVDERDPEAKPKAAPASSSAPNGAEDSGPDPLSTRESSVPDRQPPPPLAPQPRSLQQREPTSSDQILRRLNRGEEQRPRKAAKPRRKKASKPDPMRDYVDFGI